MEMILPSMVTQVAAVRIARETAVNQLMEFMSGAGAEDGVNYQAITKNQPDRSPIGAKDNSPGSGRAADATPGKRPTK